MTIQVFIVDGAMQERQVQFKVQHGFECFRKVSLDLLVHPLAKDPSRNVHAPTR